MSNDELLRLVKETLTASHEFEVYAKRETRRILMAQILLVIVDGLLGGLYVVPSMCFPGVSQSMILAVVAMLIVTFACAYYILRAQQRYRTRAKEVTGSVNRLKAHVQRVSPEWTESSARASPV